MMENTHDHLMIHSSFHVVSINMYNKPTVTTVHAVCVKTSDHNSVLFSASGCLWFEDYLEKQVAVKCFKYYFSVMTTKENHLS